MGLTPRCWTSHVARCSRGLVDNHGNALDVAERGLTGTDGQESDGLVDTAERRDIDSLATDGTSGTDTGAIFTGTAVDNGIDGDLEGVLVGHDVDLIEAMSVF